MIKRKSRLIDMKHFLKKMEVYFSQRFTILTLPIYIPPIFFPHYSESD